jgi:hypothetical protein
LYPEATGLSQKAIVAKRLLVRKIGECKKSRIEVQGSVKPDGYGIDFELSGGDCVTLALGR